MVGRNQKWFPSTRFKQSTSDFTLSKSNSKNNPFLIREKAWRRKQSRQRYGSGVVNVCLDRAVVVIDRMTELRVLENQDTPKTTPI